MVALALSVLVGLAVGLLILYVVNRFKAMTEELNAIRREARKNKEAAKQAARLAKTAERLAAASASPAGDVRRAASEVARTVARDFCVAVADEMVSDIGKAVMDRVAPSPTVTEPTLAVAVPAPVQRPAQSVAAPPAQRFVDVDDYHGTEVDRPGRFDAATGDDGSGLPLSHAVPAHYYDPDSDDESDVGGVDSGDESGVDSDYDLAVPTFTDATQWRPPQATEANIWDGEEGGGQTAAFDGMTLEDMMLGADVTLASIDAGLALVVEQALGGGSGHAPHIESVSESDDNDDDNGSGQNNGPVEAVVNVPIEVDVSA